MSFLKFWFWLCSVCICSRVYGSRKLARSSFYIYCNDILVVCWYLRGCLSQNKLTRQIYTTVAAFSPEDMPDDHTSPSIDIFLCKVCCVCCVLLVCMRASLHSVFAFLCVCLLWCWCEYEGVFRFKSCLYICCANDFIVCSAVMSFLDFVDFSKSVHVWSSVTLVAVFDLTVY